MLLTIRGWGGKMLNPAPKGRMLENVFLDMLMCIVFPFFSEEVLPGCVKRGCQRIIFELHWVAVFCFCPSSFGLLLVCMFNNSNTFYCVSWLGEAISGTQRYFSKHFLIKICFRTSGGAILGTRRYCSKHFLINICFRASVEATLDTQRYFSKRLLTNIVLFWLPGFVHFETIFWKECFDKNLAHKCLTIISPGYRLLSVSNVSKQYLWLSICCAWFPKKVERCNKMAKMFQRTRKDSSTCVTILH